MNHGHYLPCECGKKWIVQKSQAGQELTCECGKTLQVPTLRGLTLLEDAAPSSSAPAVRAARRWNPIFGIPAAIFLGISMVTLGLCLYYGYWRLQLNPTYQIADEIRNGEEMLDQMPPAELLNLYHVFRTEGLGPKSPPPFYVEILVAKDWEKNIAYYGSISAAFFALGLATTFLSRKIGR